MPFSFLAPVCAMVCASVKFNVTWFNKFYLYKDTIYFQILIEKINNTIVRHCYSIKNSK